MLAACIINVGVWLQIVPQHNSSFRHSWMHRTFWCCVCHLLIQQVFSILVSTYGFRCRLLNVVFFFSLYKALKSMKNKNYCNKFKLCIASCWVVSYFFVPPVHTGKKYKPNYSFSTVYGETCIFKRTPY